MDKLLALKLKRIFGVKDVILGAPGDKQEQDVLFVGIERNRTSMTKNKINFMIEGVITMYSQIDKLPLGFFHKKVEQAKVQDKEGFFFHRFDEGSMYSIQNLCERTVSFVLVSSEQYDPDKGLLNRLEL